MKKVFLISFLFSSGFVISQSSDSLFKDLKFRKNVDSFLPVFVANPSFLARKEISFHLSNSSSQKPVFCRMEDNISNHYNVMFQLRAGSDLDYRKIAFPKKVESSSKYIE
jgi:hypothetical protein